MRNFYLIKSFFWKGAFDRIKHVRYGDIGELLDLHVIEDDIIIFSDLGFIFMRKSRLITHPSPLLKREGT